MSNKEIIFNEEGRQKIAKGVKILAKAVKSTLGPKGRNVMISKDFGSPKVTKDGVTVAREITLSDPFENMGAQLVKDVASKTADKAGDGTTTATVLTEAIYLEGLKVIAMGANPVYVKRGIDKAAAAVIKNIENNTKLITTSEEIKQVAIVSSNWDKEIGEIVAAAVERVGKDGTVTVDESRGIETTLTVVEGMQFDKGYLSPFFASSADTLDCVLDNPYILVFDKKISSMKELYNILSEVQKTGKSMLIIAEDVEGEALATLVVNKMRETIKVCAVRAPGFGDRRKALSEDIAVITGGKYITEEAGRGLETTKVHDLGRAKKVIITKDSTTIIEGHGKQEDINSRAVLIRKQIEASTSDFDKTKLAERLAKIAGGVAVISVGAPSESELGEKKDRVDDALHATKAAIQEGIVPGGGFAIINAIRDVKELSFELTGDEQLGAEIVLKSLSKPLLCLCENAGLDGTYIFHKVLETGLGYNIATNQYEDLMEAGVIDPAKVTKTAILNASSVAGLMLTTECLIAETSKKE